MHKTGAFIEIDPSGNINVCGSTLNVNGSSYINLIAPKIYQNIRTGTTGTLAGAQTATISFSPNLPSTDYTVVAASGDTSRNHPMPGILNKTISSFDMNISSGDAGVYQWIAITNTNNIG